jgi:hypothetical protein
MERSNLMSISDVRTGVWVVDVHFLDREITPSTILHPRSGLLHRLIEDILWLAGGANKLGGGELLYDDDPWTGDSSRHSLFTRVLG